MRIVTVSREFGSGGREVGKRLADELGFAYFDREILAAVAQKSSLSEDYIERTLESGVLRQYPLTFGRTLYHLPSVSDATSLLADQHKVLREIASSGDCVIVGRGANAVLKEFDPFDIFVYADKESKMKRCRERASEAEKMSDRELERRMKQIDKARAENSSLISEYPWGDKRGYDLCINTSGKEIKAIVPAIAQLANQWFTRND